MLQKTAVNPIKWANLFSIFILGEMSRGENVSFAGGRKKGGPAASFLYIIYQDIYFGFYFPSLMRTAVLLTAGMSAAITQRIVSTPMVVKLYIKE